MKLMGSILLHQVRLKFISSLWMVENAFCMWFNRATVLLKRQSLMTVVIQLLPKRSRRRPCYFSQNGNFWIYSITILSWRLTSSLAFPDFYANLQFKSKI